jgi:sialate O-acetylesterase
VNIHYRLIFLSAAFLISTPSAFALTLPHIFGDHMVLQSGQRVPVWGWAKPGEEITVRFADQEKHARAAAASDGRWEIHLEPLKVSSEPAELTIVGAEKLTFKDVLVGEVWLCSGQSNMEKPLGEQRGQKPTLNYERELATANFPEIRFLRVPRNRKREPERDIKTTWNVCSPASLDEIKFSAVGYFFGRKLHQELKVPIGMIDASLGGSPIEPWITPAGFASVPSLADWAKASITPGATVDVYQGANVIHSEPCTMYRGMIAPLVPFALRGVLWYQGESNIYAGDTTIYADKMTALINGWRDAWKRELPFYYVQIAPLLYHVTRSDKVVSPEAEPRFWEAQASCLRLPRTGMIVTTDLVDDLADIHPQRKKEVGEPLARWALAKDYGRTDIEVSGPMFRSMERNGGKVTLHFDHIGGGLVCKGRVLDWFAIAGTDGEFFPAKAEIAGDTVVVTSPRVSAPAVVRFAWDEAARPNFFSKAGLPAMPFRTDNPFTQVNEKLRKP